MFLHSVASWAWPSGVIGVDENVTGADGPTEVFISDADTGKELRKVTVSRKDKQAQDVTVNVQREDGRTFSFDARVRIDAEAEAEYYVNGGIMPMVFRQMLAGVR